MLMQTRYNLALLRTTKSQSTQIIVKMETVEMLLIIPFSKPLPALKCSIMISETHLLQRQRTFHLDSSLGKVVKAKSGWNLLKYESRHPIITIIITCHRLQIRGNKNKRNWRQRASSQQWRLQWRLVTQTITLQPSNERCPTLQI